MKPENIKIVLKGVERDQAYLAKVFKKKKQQIWNAIHTDKYPTLKKKILNHLQLLQDRQIRSQSKKSLSSSASLLKEKSQLTQVVRQRGSSL